MVKAAALWLKTNENGEKFFVGNMGDGVSVFVYKNKYKKADNHPDYLLYFAENKKKKDKPQNFAPSNEPEF